MKRIVTVMFLSLFTPLGFAQTPNPPIPENFPRFQIQGHEETGTAMRDMLWHHYHGAVPVSTFEDGWLSAPSLWPDTDKAESNRERWKAALLARKIDAEGYVTTLQHHGYAHADGWPFPLHSQGGSGWVFTHVHGAFYNEQYGVNLTTSLDGFRLQGLNENGNENGIEEQTGVKLHITDANAVLTSPRCSIDAETISLLRWDWDVKDAVPTIYLEWTTESEPAFSAERRAVVSLPAEGEYYSHIFVNKEPLWRGKVTRLRLVFENGQNANINLRSWIATFDSRHNINQSCFIKGCYDYLQWTGDVDFLQRNMNRMRAALEYAISEFEMEKYHCVRMSWTGHDGRSGIDLDAAGNTVQNVGRGIGGNYWDILPFGGRDCLATIYYYDAILKMAALEEVILKHPDWEIPATATVRSPEWLQALAQKLKDANDMFWNAETGRFVSAIDIDNVRYDFGFTFVNNEAIYYGYANDEQAKSILSWLNGDRIVDGDTSQGADIYHWRFGPRATTKRNLDYYFWGWTGAATIPFGDQVQDGGAVLGFAFHDLMARIRYLGADNAAKYLAENVKWFREVQAEGGYRKFYAPDKHRGNMQGGNVPGGLGLDLEFLESVLYPQVMLFGFMGFEPKLDGFVLRPNLPKDWPDLAIDRIRWQDQNVSIHATKSAIDVTFTGPERSVKIDLPGGTWRGKTVSGKTIRLETIPSFPHLPDTLLEETYRQAATKNVLAAVNPEVFPGYWSVCADGQGFGYGNSYPSLDGLQLADALLWLGQEDTVRLNWDYVRTFLKEDGALPLAILPASAGQPFGNGVSVDPNGGLYTHWVIGNPLAALAAPTFIVNTQILFEYTQDRDWLAQRIEAVNLSAEQLMSLTTDDGRVRGAGYYVERPTRVDSDGVSQTHAINAFEHAADMNRLLGRDADAERLSQQAQKIRKFYVEHFWQTDHFAEYFSPERGFISHHGLTDSDWGAIAFGVATPAQTAVLWPQLSTEKRFYYGNMPAGIATKPETYEDWEFTHPDRHDLGAMGRVWYLMAQAMYRQNDAQGLLASLRAVAEEGKKNDYYWRERYHPDGNGGCVPAGPNT